MNLGILFAGIFSEPLGTKGWAYLSLEDESVKWPDVQVALFDIGSNHGEIFSRLLHDTTPEVKRIQPALVYN